MLDTFFRPRKTPGPERASADSQAPTAVTAPIELPNNVSGKNLTAWNRTAGEARLREQKRQHRPAYFLLSSLQLLSGRLAAIYSTYLAVKGYPVCQNRSVTFSREAHLCKI